MDQEKGERRVQWDEEKLKETEKFRGTFEKIDEPKTPYRANSSSDEQEEPTEKSEEEIALDQSLYRAKMNRSTNCAKRLNIAQLNARLKQQLSPYHTSPMQDEQQQAKQKRKSDFKKLRSQHYNQFKMIQQIQHQRWQDDD